LTIVMSVLHLLTILLSVLIPLWHL